MFELLFKVTFCFGLGPGVLVLISELVDFLTGYHFSHALFGTRNGALILIFSGLVAVSLAIWGGQFVEDVKPTHWSRRRKNSN